MHSHSNTTQISRAHPHWQWARFTAPTFWLLDKIILLYTSNARKASHRRERLANALAGAAAAPPGS